MGWEVKEEGWGREEERGVRRRRVGEERRERGKKFEMGVEGSFPLQVGAKSNYDKGNSSPHMDGCVLVFFVTFCVLNLVNFGKH